MYGASCGDKICAQIIAIFTLQLKGVQMSENDLRKRVQVGKKTERLVFAVTPEMKASMEKIAEANGTSVSSMLTQLATDEILANKSLFVEEGELCG